ncbi:hypothetical protein [Actinoplanes aureus]|uniref:Secreted protein n=1 Tax=Actinoplanes aureus TaxID=2792083 RepID=A0A931CEN6_9ACTN|nr:hypothetical protein [Actinoplanes aureus]MBG0566107.1 hypothetical protein [Actinoplanes aureus]
MLIAVSMCTAALTVVPASPASAFAYRSDRCWEDGCGSASADRLSASRYYRGQFSTKDLRCGPLSFSDYFGTVRVWWSDGSSRYVPAEAKRGQCGTPKAYTWESPIRSGLEVIRFRYVICDSTSSPGRGCFEGGDAG